MPQISLNLLQEDLGNSYSFGPQCSQKHYSIPQQTLTDQIFALTR